MKWSDLLQWEGSSLSQQAQVYDKNVESLKSASESLDANLSSLTGQGNTVNAARRALLKLRVEIEEQAVKMEAIASILSEASEGAETVGTAARKLDGTAANHSIHIGADGSVQYVGPHNVSPADAVTIKKNMKIVSDQVSAIVQKARSVVQNAQSKLAALGGGASSYANGSTTETRVPKKDLKLPPKGASEKEVAKWWSSLSDAEKEQMIKAHPQEIGNLNGIDGTSRNKANRIYLEDATKREEKKLERLKKRYGSHPSRRERQELELVEERVKALHNVKDTIDREEPWPDGDGIQRQLLSLDTSGKHVTAAVAQGNVDTADHVGVIVPGLYSNVATNLGKYDDDAKVMGANVRKHSNGESVAMISYLGYEAPQNIAEVADIGYAQKGADKLAGFLNGLDASREAGPAGDAHISVAGHSFGSTTAGIALTKVNPGVVDDLIQFGSPGAGVQDVSEFKLEKGHAWVSATDIEQDRVQGMGDDLRFGKDPAKMPGYNHLSGDVGDKIDESQPYAFQKHGGYFNEGSKALDDISKVIAGRGKK